MVEETHIVIMNMHQKIFVSQEMQGLEKQVNKTMRSP